MKVISDSDVLGKRVFLRADLDVPVSLTANGLQLKAESGKQLATRLTNLKPTVDWLLAHGAQRIIIAGHIGRPSHKASDGKPPFVDPALSTKQLLEPLERILGQGIAYSQQLTANSLQKKTVSSGQSAVSGKQIVLLENLRFWPGEEKNDPEFAKQLASTSDVYINEAFAASHRAHASTTGVPAILPHAAGIHLAEEVNQLTKLIKNPERPFAAIIGGVKLETKVPVIEKMAELADFVLVGGLIAKEYQMSNIKYQISKKTIVAQLTPDGKDISEESINKFAEVIKNAKTIVWNGPVGYFEGGFDNGTIAIARAIIGSGAYSVVGGGETTEFLGSKDLLPKFSFVSAGGGAMLEFLAGKELPGIKALE